jgi:hypothetical protein
MALQPIDLQTLFMQMDKVGKEQGALLEGVQIQQDLQDIKQQERTAQRTRAVKESQDAGEGLEHIRDRKNQSRGRNRKGGNRNPKEESDNPEDKELIQDPALGRNIDISG